MWTGGWRCTREKSNTIKKGEGTQERETNSTEKHRSHTAVTALPLCIVKCSSYVTSIFVLLIFDAKVLCLGSGYRLRHEKHLARFSGSVRRNEMGYFNYVTARFFLLIFDVTVLWLNSELQANEKQLSWVRHMGKALRFMLRGINCHCLIVWVCCKQPIHPVAISKVSLSHSAQNSQHASCLSSTSFETDYVQLLPYKFRQT